jgi:signal-transduction protein with cAMP-binding, CBS, and nucleotidyltransferase domain
MILQQRLWNKEQKRIRLEREEGSNSRSNDSNSSHINATLADATTGRKRHLNNNNNRKKAASAGDRKSGSMVKGWMLQHIRTVEASKTMAEVETVLLDADIGCIPVVADGTNQLVGMVTRTDLLRQHRYYNSLYYNNRGMSDSIANRRPAIIALRKKLKMFDLENE